MRCRYAEGLALLFALIGGCWGEAQTTNIAVAPEADAFVLSTAPANNYGGAGAISVSGSAATNGSGQQNGLFDSVLRFPMNGLVASVDGAFGTHNWMITRVTLRLVELGAPANALFNRGVGAFEIRWMASDNWMEGSGTPNAPTVDGVTFGDLSSILGSGNVSLGQFTNQGVDGPVSFSLALTQPLLADIRSGTLVSLYLTAASSQVGFTADSRSFGTASARPSLEITAVATPLPQFLSIASVQAGQVYLTFDTVSNWNHALQYSDRGTEANNWSNLVTVSAQPTNGHVAILAATTNGVRFYRLSLSP
jgi:hypothetical protein